MDVNKLNSTEKKIYEVLKTVIDPELGISLVELGLIYEIKVDKDGQCKIDWTLTTLGCPVIDILTGSIYEAAMSVEGVKKCSINLVFEPEWTPEKMSREARMTLGIHL